MRFISISRIFSVSACLMSVLLALKLFDIAGYFLGGVGGQPLGALLAAPAHAVAAPAPQTASSEETTEATTAHPSSGTAPAPDMAARMPVPPAPDDPRRVALLEDLAARQRQLDDLDRSLAERQRIVAASEAALQQKMTVYERAIADYKARAQSSQDMSDADMARLVRIYENMSPRDASVIFDVLDMHVMVRVLDHMNPRKASAIMAGMTPERVNLTTQMLASLHTNATKVALSGAP